MVFPSGHETGLAIVVMESGKSNNGSERNIPIGGILRAFSFRCQIVLLFLTAHAVARIKSSVNRIENGCLCLGRLRILPSKIQAWVHYCEQVS